MTNRRSIPGDARRRVQRTGEDYATALRQVRKSRAPTITRIRDDSRPMPSLAEIRALSGAMRRHPAEVTADRLAEALEKWPDAFDGGDRDMIGQVIHILRTIAEGRTES